MLRAFNTYPYFSDCATRRPRASRWKFFFVASYPSVLESRKRTFPCLITCHDLVVLRSETMFIVFFFLLCLKVCVCLCDCTLRLRVRVISVVCFFCGSSTQRSVRLRGNAISGGKMSLFCFCLLLVRSCCFFRGRTPFTPASRLCLLRFLHCVRKRNEKNKLCLARASATKERRRRCKYTCVHAYMIFLPPAWDIPYDAADAVCAEYAIRRGSIKRPAGCHRVSLEIRKTDVRFGMV